MEEFSHQKVTDQPSSGPVTEPTRPRSSTTDTPRFTRHPTDVPRVEGKAEDKRDAEEETKEDGVGGETWAEKELREALLNPTRRIPPGPMSRADMLLSRERRRADPEYYWKSSGYYQVRKGVWKKGGRLGMGRR